MENKMNCDQVRELDLVDYLNSLGLQPYKIKGINFWYYSPFREEKTPSFKINRKLNRWFDFGEGVGGNLIDFAIRYRGCTIGEFLDSISSNSISFHKPRLSRKKNNTLSEPKIQIIAIKSLRSTALLRYLESRKISIRLADEFCKEISYQLKDKRYYAIGFKNLSGGYELRNSYFKGSSSPKNYSLVQRQQSDVLTVFEGFFDFLSFLTLIDQSGLDIQSDFLILNSLSLFEKGRRVFDRYRQVDLYLDNDAAGDRYTFYACSLGEHIHDSRQLYKNHKDLNDFLCHSGI